MQRNEFLKALGRALRPLRADERKRYLANYAELLDDKLETGMSEEAAIAELGDPAELARPILADAEEQGALRPRRSPLTLCLLALGSPVWLALLAAGLAVLLALYMAAWTLVLAAYAVELALLVVLPAAVIYVVANVASNLPFSVFVLGLGLASAAVAIALWRPLRRLVSGFAVASASAVKRLVAHLKTKGSALL